MHCHLGFLSWGSNVALRLAEQNSLLFVNTVEPDDFVPTREQYAACPNVRVGIGMHPWWVDGTFAPDQFAERAATTRFIGEIGLDFGKRGANNRDEQVEAFGAIARICAAQGDKLLSIHAVKSAETTLDMLETAGVLETCTCIFHWYSGPSEQLKRLLDAGCYVSANRFMLQTRRGREYVKAIPTSRLLLETDEPPEDASTFSAEDHCAALREAAEAVASIKGPEALGVIARTSEMLLR